MRIKQELSERLGTIRTRFLGVLSQRRAEFQEIRLELIADAGADNALDELRFGVHKILGVASTLGFDDLGHLASVTIQDIDIFGKSNATTIKDGNVSHSLDRLIDEMTSLLDSDPALRNETP